MIKYLFGDKSIVPVVMFHSVGLHDAIDWPYHYISEPLLVFENKIKILHECGYNFIFWKDLYLYMKGIKKIPLPAIMLTFDDGYLDNWTRVYSVLKKYGAKGTIFVSPEFVDPCIGVREQCIGSTDKKNADNSTTDRGFLNWDEMRFMEKSGLIDIQSHAMTHTWYFSGGSLLGFHSPGDNSLPWLQWNQNPELKPFYMEKGHQETVPFGLPIYEHEKALICKQYFPPKEIEKYLTSFVEDSGGEKFFKKINWKDILFKKFKYCNDKYRFLGRHEENKEYEIRVFDELYQSKKNIEYQLDKKVDFICWPGGAYNKKVLSFAKEIGYKSWTLGSRDNSSFRNSYAVGPENVKRIGSYTKVKIGDINLGFASGKDFIISIKRHQYSLLYKYYDYFSKFYKFTKR